MNFALSLMVLIASPSGECPQNLARPSLRELHESFTSWRQRTLELAGAPRFLSDPRWADVVDPFLGVTSLRDVYTAVHTGDPGKSIAEKALDHLHIEVRYDRQQLLKIPKKGPVIIVANHPFGVVDGFALQSAIQEIRPDTKMMITTMLKGLVRDDPDFIVVDNLTDESINRENAAGLRAALRWLKRDQGVLIVFPASEVSRYRRETRKIEDGVWEPNISKLILKTRSAVVPIFVEGRNSRLFYWGGRLYSPFYRFSLIREFVNKSKSSISLRIGHPIPPSILEGFHPEHLASTLRAHVYNLSKTRDQSSARYPLETALNPVAEPSSPENIEAEVLRLASLEGKILSGGIGEATPLVIYFSGRESPLLVRELGILREKVFRSIGEGTGKSLDTDEYDARYTHIVAWDASAKKIMGAYRLVGSDEVGIRGMYTSRFFRYSANAIYRMGPFLELGRAFVLPEYRGKGLSFLWKGIGSFLIRNPHYRSLIGLVSLSQEVNPYSQVLITEFLRKHYRAFEELGQPVEDRRLQSPSFPLDILHAAFERTFQDGQPCLTAVENITNAVGAWEECPSPFPQLLYYYGDLLGGRVVDFMQDPEFNSIDFLYLVDVHRVPPRILRMFLGPSYKDYLDPHGTAANP